MGDAAACCPHFTLLPTSCFSTITVPACMPFLFCCIASTCFPHLTCSHLHLCRSCRQQAAGTGLPCKLKSLRALAAALEMHRSDCTKRSAKKLEAGQLRKRRRAAACRQVRSLSNPGFEELPTPLGIAWMQAGTGLLSGPASERVRASRRPAPSWLLPAAQQAAVQRHGARCRSSVQPGCWRRQQAAQAAAQRWRRRRRSAAAPGSPAPRSACRPAAAPGRHPHRRQPAGGRGPDSAQRFRPGRHPRQAAQGKLCRAGCDHLPPVCSPAFATALLPSAPAPLRNQHCRWTASVQGGTSRAFGRSTGPACS